MTIEKRPFGSTGHMSSAVIFGAAALGDVDQGTADKVLDLLFEYGINHIDTAASYGDAELRIGPPRPAITATRTPATKSAAPSTACARTMWI
jgi:aryl-alcohol dehydrogenase-like predicted oxidoreductase